MRRQMRPRGQFFFPRCVSVRPGFWSPGPLVPSSSGLSILWSSVAASGRLETLPITPSGASEKIGLLQHGICGC